MTIDITKSKEHLAYALYLSRQEVIKKHGFIDFFCSFESKKENTKTGNFESMFNARIWEVISGGPTGHKKIRHILTRTVIEYVAHEHMMDPGAMVSVAKQIQRHVNRLGNVVFGYKLSNWAKSPNMLAVAAKFFNQRETMRSKVEDCHDISMWKSKEEKKKKKEGEVKEPKSKKTYEISELGFELKF
jgi:hypothetical protein